MECEGLDLVVSQNRRTAMQPEVPPELMCATCNELLDEAVMMPCCAGSLCEACARLELEGGDLCPICKVQTSLDDLIPYRLIREKVELFLRKSGYSRPRNLPSRQVQQSNVSLHPEHNIQSVSVQPSVPGIKQSSPLTHSSTASSTSSPQSSPLPVPSNTPHKSVSSPTSIQQVSSPPESPPPLLILPPPKLQLPHTSETYLSDDCPSPVPQTPPLPLSPPTEDQPFSSHLGSFTPDHQHSTLPTEPTSQQSPLPSRPPISSVQQPSKEALTSAPATHLSSGRQSPDSPRGTSPPRTTPCPGPRTLISTPGTPITSQPGLDTSKPPPGLLLRPTLLPPPHVLGGQVTPPRHQGSRFPLNRTQSVRLKPSDDPLVAFELAMAKLDSKKSQGRASRSPPSAYRRRVSPVAHIVMGKSRGRKWDGDSLHGSDGFSGWNRLDRDDKLSERFPDSDGKFREDRPRPSDGPSTYYGGRGEEHQAARRYYDRRDRGDQQSGRYLDRCNLEDQQSDQYSDRRDRKDQQSGKYMRNDDDLPGRFSDRQGGEDRLSGRNSGVYKTEDQQSDRYYDRRVKQDDPLGRYSDKRYEEDDPPGRYSDRRDKDDDSPGRYSDRRDKDDDPLGRYSEGYNDPQRSGRFKGKRDVEDRKYGREEEEKEIYSDRWRIERYSDNCDEKDPRSRSPGNNWDRLYSGKDWIASRHSPGREREDELSRRNSFNSDLDVEDWNNNNANKTEFSSTPSLSSEEEPKCLTDVDRSTPVGKRKEEFDDYSSEIDQCYKKRKIGLRAQYKSRNQITTNESEVNFENENKNMIADSDTESGIGKNSITQQKVQETSDPENQPVVQSTPLHHDPLMSDSASVVQGSPPFCVGIAGPSMELSRSDEDSQILELKPEAGKEIDEGADFQTQSLDPAHKLSEAIASLLKSRSEREMAASEVPNYSQNSDSPEKKSRKKKDKKKRVKKNEDEKNKDGKAKMSKREKTLMKLLSKLGKEDLEKIISEGNKWDALFKPKSWRIISKSVSKKKKVKVKRSKKIVERIHDDERSDIEDKKVYLASLHESLQDMQTMDKKSPTKGKNQKKKKKHKLKRDSSEDRPNSREKNVKSSSKRHCNSEGGDNLIGRQQGDGDENDKTKENKTEKNKFSGTIRSPKLCSYSRDGIGKDVDLTGSGSPRVKNRRDESSVRRRPKDENLCSSLESLDGGAREVWKRDGKIRIQVSNKKVGATTDEKPASSRGKFPSSGKKQHLSPAAIRARLGPPPSH